MTVACERDQSIASIFEKLDVAVGLGALATRRVDHERGSKAVLASSMGTRTAVDRRRRLPRGTRVDLGGQAGMTDATELQHHLSAPVTRHQSLATGGDRSVTAHPLEPLRLPCGGY